MNDVHIRGDLNLFRVMLAIAEEGSTVGAAERLSLSQSAVSHALKRLREHLNDPVFVKHGRNLVLTPHGKYILPSVSAALNSLAQCHARPGEFDPLASDMVFEIGFRDILEFLVLPDLIGPLRKAGSNLHFKTRTVPTDQLEECLLSGQLDIAVDLDFPTSDRIRSEIVARENLCVMLGPEHPSYHQKRLSLSDFVGADHALVILDKRERAYIDQQLGGVGAKRRVVMHCEHYLPAARVVAVSDLVLTMPFSFAHYISKALPVRLFPLPFPSEPLPVRMYWRDESSDEPYMVWLKSRVNAALESGLPVFDL